MDTPETLEEAHELRRLADLCGVPTVRTALETAAKRADDRRSASLSAANAATAASAAVPIPQSVAAATTASVKYYTKISKYAWDQEKGSVTLYLSDLSGIEDLPAEQLKVSADKDVLTVKVESLHGKNYSLMLHLAAPVESWFESPPMQIDQENNPHRFSFKARKGRLTIRLKKTEAKNWSSLTESERKRTEPSPDLDKDADPQDSIMNMMKKMYDEGDEDMKRTIAKAWTESRNKTPTENLA